MLNTTDTTFPGTDQHQSPGATRRRTLALGGLASAIAGLVTLSSATPAIAGAELLTTDDDPDLELKQLCARIVSDCKQQSILQEQMYDLVPYDPDYDRILSRIQELDDEARQLAERVGKLPAHTPEGIQARAAAIKALLPTDFEIGDLVPIDWHRGMLDALLRDVVGRA